MVDQHNYYIRKFAFNRLAKLNLHVLYIEHVQVYYMGLLNVNLGKTHDIIQVLHLKPVLR